MQVSWFEVEVKVKRGQTSGVGTILSNNLRVVVGQSVDPGMRRTRTIRAVSPACRVLVLVTVRQAPELLKWTLPLDKVCCWEKLSNAWETRLPVRKKVKKLTRRAHHQAKRAELHRLRWAWKWNKINGIRGALRCGMWIMDFSRPFCVSLIWMSSKAEASKWLKAWRCRRVLR